MLDENVPMSARRFLNSVGYEATFVRDLIPEGSVDPLVAFISEEKSAILVSFDGDFKKIAPRIPDGQKARFKKLSRIWLKCNEYQSAMRLEVALSLIETEYELSKGRHDQRMQLCIGSSYIRTER